MFGYVRVSKGELKMKEYDIYHGVYCSLCKYLGKEYGLISRFALSYDFTFLTMLILATKDTCPGFKKGRCRFNPLKKCNYCEDFDGFGLPAAATVVSTYYKILDNVADEKGIKKAAFRILKLLFSGKYKKARNKYPKIDTLFSEYIEKQSQLEKSKETSIDIAADPTATALSRLLGFCTDDDTARRIYSRLGYCIGRYIYLLDAACDYEKDKKSGSYNVFSFCANDKKAASERVKPQLYASISEAAKAFELMDFKRYKSILGNIIYLGLEETFIKELKDE